MGSTQRIKCLCRFFQTGIFPAFWVVNKNNYFNNLSFILFFILKVLVEFTIRTQDHLHMGCELSVNMNQLINIGQLNTSLFSRSMIDHIMNQ